MTLLFGTRRFDRRLDIVCMLNMYALCRGGS